MLIFYCHMLLQVSLTTQSVISIEGSYTLLRTPIFSHVHLIDTWCLELSKSLLNIEVA